MTSTVKTYARFCAQDWSLSTDDITVQNIQDAVTIALKCKSIYFQTYQKITVQNDGKTFLGEAHNISCRHYVGISEVFSRDAAIAEMLSDRAIANDFFGQDITPALREAFQKAQQPVVALYRTAPAHTFYFQRNGQFFELAEGEKVFNRAGAQIWPNASGLVAASVPPVQPNFSR